MSGYDPTESIRRALIGKLEPEGERWTTEELRRDFEVLGYAAPLVVVRRRSDGALGSLAFTHAPRVYFGWEPHEEEQ